MTDAAPSPLFGPMRLPFLILTPACVLVGVATAVWSGASISPLPVIMALAGAVAAHISVNALNEYEDFHTGLDFKTERTPFSGGSGALPGNPGQAHQALLTGVASALFTVSVGVYFTILRGWEIIPLGLLGLLVIVIYTRWITRSPLLCLIAPGLGFGPLMVMGTHFALTGTYSMTAFVASLVPFFLVSDLLLLNQFPDVEADREIGRQHLPIAWGIRAAVGVYILFLALTYLSIIAGVLLGLLPTFALLGLGTLIIAIPTARGAARYAESIPELVPHLGRNVLVVIATPVLMAIGIFIG
jgi:1,4-dihydroxy-2-naphthoate octaprenyltransferase